ncbi:hypothetical protein [Actinopolyspora mortivallis]|uniref:Uncharacterized protein n=1 Tax=Actinopolyspora mortivallis TaxID=33906 RepID=A0A2T0GXN3_ACTMO|nr:hypothetical protein [Actinopolyspora mortivallis]PRW63868.1 hypothetical protein CEP50_07775 [Actinopolyspora mortivallis]
MRDSENEPESVGTGSAELHQPWRLGVCGAELVLAALLVVGALLAWDRSVVTIEVPGASGGTVVSRMLGSWVTLAVAAVTAAGLLVLDGSRQLVLGTRPRRRRARAGSRG